MAEDKRRELAAIGPENFAQINRTVAVAIGAGASGMQNDVPEMDAFMCGESGCRNYSYSYACEKAPEPPSHHRPRTSTPPPHCPTASLPDQASRSRCVSYHRLVSLM